MSVELKSLMGWEEVLVLANDAVELVITLDVGPRIISYRRHNGNNVFKVFDDQLGRSGEQDWQIRGGHRLWAAPENDSTYFPDNQPVPHRIINELRVRLCPAPEVINGLTKELDVSLDLSGSRVRISHSITALRDHQSAIAAWALTVLKPGGTAIVPMPPRGLHPNDQPAEVTEDSGLQPDRHLSLWPYTDLSDSRFTWLEDRLEISQDSQKASTKIGFLHRRESASYEIDGLRFSKTIDFQEGADYPDGQSNLEIFTDGAMLELESLGPLTTLSKGAQIVHTETWTLETV